MFIMPELWEAEARSLYIQAQPGQLSIFKKTLWDDSSGKGFNAIPSTKEMNKWVIRRACLLRWAASMGREKQLDCLCTYATRVAYFPQITCIDREKQPAMLHVLEATGGACFLGAASVGRENHRNIPLCTAALRGVLM